uniref:UDP-glycosyltransferases domain-containing protein n=1 Tax=Leersia perrieri TaxID=77586 RepID=A0A0D9WX45_9ORYZ
MASNGGHGQRRVLVLSLPFEGHINPMLQLAGALHGRGGLSVTVLHTRFNALDPSCNPELSVTVLHTRFNALDASRHPDLAFVEVPDGLTAELAASSNVTRIILAINAAMEGESASPSSPSFRDVLASVVAADGDEGRPPAACLIIDSNLRGAQKAAAGLGLPTLVLRTGSAACLGCYLAYPTLIEKGYLPPKESQLYEPVKELPPLRIRDLFYSKDANLEMVSEVLAKITETVRNSMGVVINTFDDLEPAELKKIHNELGDKFTVVLAAGPLHKLSSMHIGSSLKLRPDQRCIEWLDTQATQSVLYVSFGSLVSLDSDEFLEVACGLERSGQPFLWVVRPDLVRGGFDKACLPDGFERAVEGRGKVIQWAPQQEVLAHHAIGGFWTHNGWNSTLESISEGVPMICRPQLADQPLNTRYMEAVWGVGFELEGKLERGKIEKSIRKLMVEKEGAGMRERAKKLKNKVEGCLKNGGSSQIAIDSVDGGVRRGGGCGERRRVLVFPLPFQGHINPMLHLAGTLHGRGGISVTVLHTRFNAPDPSCNPELAFVEVPDGIPADIIPILNAAIEGVSLSSSPSFRDVLASVVAADADEGQPAASCLIIDSNLRGAQKVATGIGIPTLVLRTGSAASLGCYIAYPTLIEKGYLPRKELPPLRVRDLFYSNNANFEIGVVINTFDELEPVELKKIHRELGDNIAIVLVAGPLHKLCPMNVGSSLNLRTDGSCIKWLDKQAMESVMYVSFGSLASLDSDEFLEVACGLESSGQPFLWVVRPNLVRGGFDNSYLPDGFECAVEGRCKVIEWAPQQEVLAHRAVGGLPTVDQMLNARYVEEVWGVGFELEGKLERDKIKKAVRKLVVEKEGAEMRRRAKELNIKVERCFRKGGSSEIAIDNELMRRTQSE